MINFNLDVSSPWSNRWRTMFCKYGLIGNHKAWEFNGYLTHHIIDVKFSLSFTGDHPGLFIMLGLVGYSFEFSVYDTRHEDMR